MNESDRIFNISYRIVSYCAMLYPILSHPIFYIQPSHPSIPYVSPVEMFARLWCHCDLSFLALLRVLCIPFVSLRSPSPHLLLLHVGASWSRTHTPVMPLVNILLTRPPLLSHEGQGRLDSCCTASPPLFVHGEKSRLSALCFFTKGKHKSRGLSYSLLQHSFNPLP